MGLEPMASSLRVRHATHCATPPISPNGYVLARTCLATQYNRFVFVMQLILD